MRFSQVSLDVICRRKNKRDVGNLKLDTGITDYKRDLMEIKMYRIIIPEKHPKLSIQYL